MGSYKRNKEDISSEESGIYCILNITNGKRYIGQTYDLKYRWMRHKCDLDHGYHSNNHLQSAWNKYGDKSFKFIILEKCKVESLDEREIFWINYYNSKKSGYNQSDGGLGCRGYKHTPEEIEKMRQIQHPKPVLQFSADGIFIARWVSASLAAKTIGLYSMAIRNCCEKKNHVKSVGHYIWIYEEDKDSVDMNYYLIKDEAISIVVLQYDLDMNLLNTWNSMYEISNSEFSSTTVYKVCKRKNMTYKNYIWRFKDSYDAEQYEYDKINSMKYSEIRSVHKVAKYSLDKSLISQYNSVSEAARLNNYDKDKISDCCKGKRISYKEYLWEYVI